MNRIPNRQVICEVLMEHARQDRDIVVLCTDSRGSASMTPFFQAFPRQCVEVGIAEQNAVGIAAGLASCGKKPWCASPASFLSTRSYEQAKMDVACSRTNVKLLGVSGGVSYGALGMSHHSAQDIAAMAAIPGMRVYLPSDRHQTRALTEALLADCHCAYLRTGRNPVEDIYGEGDCPFQMDRATVVCEGEDLLLVACGEMVYHAREAARILAPRGIRATVLDMYCVKPLDQTTLLHYAARVPAVITVEEHAPSGGLGSMVAQAVAEHCSRKVKCLSLPDAPLVSGTSPEVFRHYGLDGQGIAATALEVLS